MISGYMALEQDFMLFEPNTLSAAAEKGLIDLLLKEAFIDDPWLQRRLAVYVQAEPWERDRIVLDVVEFFFRGRLPADLFGVLQEFDSLFAALGKRGHFVHQFEVLVFGWALIRMLIDHNPAIHETFQGDTLKNVFSVWLMASMIHDFGYPVQMAGDTMKRLSAWYQVLGMSEVAKVYDALKERLEEAKARSLSALRSKSWKGFDINTVLFESLRESLKIDLPSAREILETLQSRYAGKIHGYVGAIVLCGKCFEAWQTHALSSISPDTSLAPLKLAMGAIFLHDLPDALGEYIARIDFRLNPYAYLLFLVDNLQDWFRDLRPSKDWPSYNLIRAQRVPTGLKIEYVLTHDKWTKDMTRRAKGSIFEKSQRLKLLSQPTPPLGFQITAEFRASPGQLLGSIDIFL